VGGYPCRRQNSSTKLSTRRCLSVRGLMASCILYKYILVKRIVVPEKRRQGGK
jgi:hypothetical protein